MTVFYINVAVRLNHVDVFIQIPVEKSRLDIHMMHGQVGLGSQTNYNPDRSELGHWCKNLFVINVVLLRESFGN